MTEDEYDTLKVRDRVFHANHSDDTSLIVLHKTNSFKCGTDPEEGEKRVVVRLDNPADESIHGCRRKYPIEEVFLSRWTLHLSTLVKQVRAKRKLEEEMKRLDTEIDKLVEALHVGLSKG